MYDKVISVLARPEGQVQLTIAIFLFSLSVAWILYRRALPRHRLDYASYDLVVLGNRYSVLKDELEIRFQGKAVPQVTTTVFAFWNNGNQTIHGAQIVESDALRIALRGDAQLLKLHIFAHTRPVIAAQVSADEALKNANVRFDYLDPGDGFGVFTAHSGSAGEAIVTGTIRGVKEGPRRLRYNRWLNAVTPLLVSIGIAIAIASIPTINAFAGHSTWLAALTTTLLCGFVAVSVCAPLLLRKQRLRSFPPELRKHPTFSGILPHLLEDS